MAANEGQAEAGHGRRAWEVAPRHSVQAATEIDYHGSSDNRPKAFLVAPENHGWNFAVRPRSLGGSSINPCPTSESDRARVRTRLLFVLVFAFVVFSLLPLVAGRADKYVSATMAVDRPEASPGELVTFSIYVDPLRDKAKTVIVTNILPEGLTLASAAAPSTCAAADGAWMCTEESLDPFTITIRAVVEHGTEGTEQVNEARVRLADSKDSLDDADRKTVIVQATVRVVPSQAIVGAILEVRLSADQLVAVPGGELDYRIEVENRGSSAATSVSVHATIPDGVALVDASPSPVVREQQLEWNIASLPVGSRTFLFSVRIPEEGAPSDLQTAVSVSYLDGGSGPPQVRSAPQSALVIPVASVLPSSPIRVLPLSTIAAVIAGVAISLLVAQRVLVLPVQNRATVDQLFLLHGSGVVLKHFSRHPLQSSDSDIVGGMLAAIQMFVQDSVDADAGPLQEIRFGERNLLFIRGENVTLAAVDARGNPGRFVEQANRFVGELERMNGHALVDFDGIAERLDDLDAAFRRFTKELARRNA